MPSLTLRNVSEEDLAWLRERAAVHRRSLNRELLDLIAVARSDEQAERGGRNPFAASHRRSRALGVRTPSSAARILRADRDRD